MVKAVALVVIQGNLGWSAELTGEVRGSGEFLETETGRRPPDVALKQGSGSPLRPPPLRGGDGVVSAPASCVSDLVGRGG